MRQDQYQGVPGAALASQGNVHGSPSSYNNDVGVPLTLLGAPADSLAYVVEMGTNAPGEIANLCRIARPTGAVLTNVGEAHLSGLGSAEGVAEEKGALVRCLGLEHFCVLNADCTWSSALARSTAARVLRFSLHGGADFMARDLRFENGRTRFVLQAPGLLPATELELPMLGAHMVQNLLAALAAVHGMGIPLENVLPHVARLRGPLRRMQVHEAGGITLIDDSYNANPLSVAAGIRHLTRMEHATRRILVVGDMLELGAASAQRHRDVGRQAALAGLDAVVAVGQFAEDVAAGAREQGLDENRLHLAADCNACQGILPALVEPGDVVLIKASRGVGLDRLVESLLEPARAH
ncbi:MAG: UDP-N-acetylmuramoyl-tripeptide--D-alanyl-D-alanine ligase [Planctomycetota bacterium]